MKKAASQNKKVYRDYKINVVNNPSNDTKFVYLYHYTIGFGATFKSIDDAVFCIEGIKPFRRW